MNIFTELINILYPQTCIICGKININFLCEKCKKRIKKYEKYKLIQSKSFYIDKLFYCYEYRGIIRKILLDYKFYNKSYICNCFAKMLLNCKKTYGFFSFYDIIIPVPIDKQKRINRGYNQTELITNIIVQKTNKSVILNKRIIVFDDIYTTGATADEISRILKENGAKEILFLVLAKD